MFCEIGVYWIYWISCSAVYDLHHWCQNTWKIYPQQFNFSKVAHILPGIFLKTGLLHRYLTKSFIVAVKQLFLQSKFCWLFLTRKYSEPMLGKISTKTKFLRKLEKINRTSLNFVQFQNSEWWVVIKNFKESWQRFFLEKNYRLQAVNCFLSSSNVLSFGKHVLYVSE